MTDTADYAPVCRRVIALGLAGALRWLLSLPAAAQGAALPQWLQVSAKWHQYQAVKLYHQRPWLQWLPTQQQQPLTPSSITSNCLANLLHTAGSALRLSVVIAAIAVAAPAATDKLSHQQKRQHKPRTPPTPWTTHHAVPQLRCCPKAKALAHLAT
jgi:hypothetical protein